MKLSGVTERIKRLFLKETELSRKQIVKKENRIKDGQRFSVFKICLIIFLILYTFSFFGMFFWAIYNSVKSPLAFEIDPWGFPKKWLWENYATAFYEIGNVQVQSSTGNITLGFWRMFLNSVVYALLGALWGTFLQCTAGYATARYKYKSSKVIYVAIMTAMVLPIIGNGPSQLLFARWFGYYDNLGLYVLMTANIVSMYYLVFFATFSTMPQDYMDAAKVDGANNYSVYFRIALPMASKMFLTIALLVFVAKWNEYEGPTLFLPSHPVLAVGLINYSNSYKADVSNIPMKLAGALIVSLPMFVIFLCFRNKLMGNISMGGLKE